MNTFFQSKFVQDLGNGKLPPVEVKFSTESLVQVAVTFVIVGIVILLASKLIKSL